MKEYPSIPADFCEFKAHVFDKLDGSNIRVEYEKKRGWFKFGSRHRVFDATDHQFGSVPALFQQEWEERLTKLARDNRWQHAVLFFEYFGPQSFAGFHVPGDVMTMHLFDAAVDKKGIMGPAEFLKTFGDERIAPYLGQVNWTRGFVERVWRGEIEGISCEGVIGKGGERHKLVMRKAKTKVWIDKIRAKLAPEEAEKIINS